jgi:hypothetical protein
MSSSHDAFGFFGTLAHGPVLESKYKEAAAPDLLMVLSAYRKFISDALAIRFTLRDPSSRLAAIKELTECLNLYRSVALPILEARDNSGQENLRSSILEEFFQLLLFPLTEAIRSSHPVALTLGKANSYVSLTFTPGSFSALFENPVPNVHTKNQDFVLGCAVNLTSSIKGQDPTTIGSSSEVVIPAVAIECKTYIERNMLDSCAGTAKRLKSAMPYCLYIVASEYMKMEDAYPELTDINELFILTKASNSDRLRFRAEGKPPHLICDSLICDVFEMVSDHLNKIWWSPEDALSRGRVIGRP